MSATNWIVYLAMAALVAGLALALYVRREPGGGSRLLPAVLRAAALALALLLVFDPWVPGLASGSRRPTLVLLDDSWSMRLPAGPAGGSRWEAALREVARLDADRVTLLSGRSIDADRLGSLQPDAAASRLVPALRAALESGTRQVVFVTDGGVTDADEASRLLSSAGASVRVVDVAAAEVANAAVAAVEAPRSGRPGEALDVRVDVAALGMEGRVLEVVLERDGAEVGRGALDAPADGRIGSVGLRLTLPEAEAGGRLTLGARLVASGAVAGDAFSEDDVRPFFIDVDERPRGIVLLSLRPDWEPRFLLPVLARSSGLPVRGYIRTPAGAWLAIGSGSGAARRVAEAVVRADLESASVAVLHGVGPGGPGWVRDRLTHPRLLVFPAAATTAGTLPAPLDAVAAAPVEPGDWYVDEQAPASPVAPLLGQVALAQLPPLTSLRTATSPAGAWVPLAARRDRRGPALPLAVAGRSGERRWIVATGTGYWRWALRGGEARRGYALFWSSLAGWLTQDMEAGSAEGLRPDAAVVERGAPIGWHASGNADSLRVRFGADAGVLDTIVPIAADRSARTAPLAPGLVTWSATAGDARASGELGVAAWSPEFVRPARDLSMLSSGRATLGQLASSRRRLHAQAWPWVLLVVLLCGEWVARRRLGLR